MFVRVRFRVELFGGSDSWLILGFGGLLVFLSTRLRIGQLVAVYLEMWLLHDFRELGDLFPRFPYSELLGASFLYDFLKYLTISIVCL